VLDIVCAGWQSCTRRTLFQVILNFHFLAVQCWTCMSIVYTPWLAFTAARDPVWTKVDCLNFKLRNITFWIFEIIRILYTAPVAVLKECFWWVELSGWCTGLLTCWSWSHNLVTSSYMILSLRARNLLQNKMHGVSNFWLLCVLCLHVKHYVCILCSICWCRNLRKKNAVVFVIIVVSPALGLPSVLWHCSWAG